MSVKVCLTKLVILYESLTLFKSYDMTSNSKSWVPLPAVGVETGIFFGE